MNTDLLTENSWKAVVQKYRIKDNGLQRALAAYDSLDESQYDDRLRRIGSVNQLANALKRTQQRTAPAEVITHVTSLIGAVHEEQQQITRDRTEARRAEARPHSTEEPDADREREQESDDQAANHGARLLAAYLKLSRSVNLHYEFTVCDAKPHYGLMIARRITPQHKTELIRLTGSRRFLPTGTCKVLSGILHLNMQRPLNGLARKLQESLLESTGRRIRVVVANEPDEDEDIEQTATTEAGERPEHEEAGANENSQGTTDAPDADESEEAATATNSATAPTEGEATERPRPAARASSLPRATLQRAPQVWHGTRDIVDRRIQALKQAIRAEYVRGEPDLVTEIDQKLSRLDEVLERLDHRLADALASAHAATNPNSQASQLRNARTILTGYINYVRANPLLTQIDANPFGVSTQLRRLLTNSLTHVAQALRPVGANN